MASGGTAVCSEDSPDVWSLVECGQLEKGEHTDLDLLMPNGFLISVRCHSDSTLAMLKQEVFNEAKRMPLFDLLLTSSDYIFFTVGTNGEREEFYDETKSIFSLRLFVPLLGLVEPEGNREEKELAHNIGLAIAHPLSEIESKLSNENISYRLDLFRVMEESVATRGVHDYDHYAFPEELSSEYDADIPPQLKAKIKVADLYVEVWYRSEEDEIAGIDSNCVCVKIRKVVRVRARDLIADAIKELTTQHKFTIRESPSDFLLQIAGRKCFLTKDIKLTSFEYVRSSFENYRIPKFLLRRKEIVLKEFPIPGPILKPSWVRAYESRLSAANDCSLKRCSLWELDDNLKMRVHSASHITVSDIDRIYVKAAVYHGTNLIVNKESEWVSPSNPRWTNGWIDFNVYLKDLAPASQVCLSLIAVKQKKKDVFEHDGIGWVNIRLFDWNNELLQGKLTLYLWPFSKHCSELLYPLGQTGSNDNRDTARIEVEFYEHGSIVEFPSFEHIYAYVNKLNARGCGTVPSAASFTPDGAEVGQLIGIARHLDGEKLTDPQQHHLWKMREYVAECMPDLLPLLAECAFIWNTRETFTRLYELLTRWGPIQPETALELLDFKYPDREIREFAVRCLDEALDNDRLQLYVMPLVQALKYEPWGRCSLARMLLKRALCSYRIGHILFWLLRAELGQIGEGCQELPNMYKRFALLIEAYCRGNFTHLDSMLRQVDMVARLTNLSKLVKLLKDKESATKRLQKELMAHVEVMQHMSSPLDPLDSLGTLRIEACKVIGSAKLPLRLTWTNPEPLARLYMETHQIIFKNGDDLRQDMLTLQVMRIMDALWKSRDLDFCLSIYEVLPMGKNVGMIHVVQNCSTLFEIQCAAKQLGSTFNMESSLINKWIRNHSDDSKTYLEAVDRFTASCAGYCVATYVLGIKDRHQDNIMLAKDGRLFHIDFGHFLGHYKKKLGINRDRVPFVLTDHFLCVIAKGKPNFRDSHEHKKFKQLCTDAYLMLHERARLFISLFTMMLCMGLPELQKMEDVDFVKRTLCAELDPQQASASFQKIFEEAFSGAWSTKTNWFFHSVKHL
uniref:Phosphatidylinositol 3-kinase age-1 n=1 Tax=Ascaris suum TaxID=6253 RepID=F1KQX2_ASCSU